MTAEILIMNKSTVALAADSAVTITSKNKVKIFNSVNKLFSLHDDYPVGIMIYNSSSINGIEWEQLIKEYKLNRKNTELDHLQDYVNDFLSFLEKGNYCPEENQKQNLKEQVIEIFFNMENHHKELQEKSPGKLLDFGVFLESMIVNFESFKKIPNSEKLTTPFARKKVEAIVSEVIDFFEKSMGKSYDGYNGEFVDLVISILGSNAESSYSGIVISGFGAKDIFPSMVELHVQFMFNNCLKYHVNQIHNITFNDSSIIVPFAQSQIVDNFLKGIDPDIQSFMYSFMETMTDEYRDFVKNLVSDEDTKEELDKIMKDLAKDKLKNYIGTLNDYKHEHFIQPIVESVKLLPKEELAIMAETLVSITSFKRKMLIGDAETVGGPIDVAVISKGDGLIWIKRKHYFDPSLNQAFVRRKGQL